MVKSAVGYKHRVLCVSNAVICFLYAIIQYSVTVTFICDRANVYATFASSCEYLYL